MMCDITTSLDSTVVQYEIFWNLKRQLTMKVQWQKKGGRGVKCSPSAKKQYQLAFLEDFLSTFDDH